jgi:hypothetical protein
LHEYCVVSHVSDFKGRKAMMEQNITVQRALDALRAVCAIKPEQIPVPPYDFAGWCVNGKHVTVFPHCPKCASYALYRKDNIGAYECMTCGLTGIEENTARRVV